MQNTTIWWQQFKCFGNQHKLASSQKYAYKFQNWLQVRSSVPNLPIGPRNLWCHDEDWSYFLWKEVWQEDQHNLKILSEIVTENWNENPSKNAKTKLDSLQEVKMDKKPELKNLQKIKMKNRTGKYISKN